MNVRNPMHAMVLPTLIVTTQWDPTSVAVILGIKEMAECAQVNF